MLNRTVKIMQLFTYNDKRTMAFNDPGGIFKLIE